MILHHQLSFNSFIVVKGTVPSLKKLSNIPEICQNIVDILLYMFVTFFLTILPSLRASEV